MTTQLRIMTVAWNHSTTYVEYKSFIGWLLLQVLTLVIGDYLRSSYGIPEHFDVLRQSINPVMQQGLECWLGAV